MAAPFLHCMNPRIVALATALVAVLFSMPTPASAGTNCVQTAGGITACGSVIVDPIVSSATGEGSADAAVPWVLTLETSGPTCSESATGTGLTFLRTIRSCSAGCATGTLSADGVIVDSHRVC